MLPPPLPRADRESFANAIASLARTNMGARAAEFDAFAAWYDRHGPYDILVDAANVAYYGQNREGGGFTWGQIQAMYELLTRRFPSKKVLVVSVGGGVCGRERGGEGRLVCAVSETA